MTDDPQRLGRHGPSRAWLRGPRGFVCLLGLVLSLFALSVPGTSGAYSARVVNTANTVTTAAAFTCAGLATAANAYYLYPMDEVLPIAGATMLDTSGNSRNGNYRGLSLHSGSSGCSSDPDGSTTFGLGSYASTPNQINSPQVFTIEIWFRTTSITGAYIMGFGNLQTGLPTVSDRHVYLTNAGKLVFGINPGTVQTITSASSYNDGAWHFVAATLGPSGMALYADGVSVGTNAATTAATNNGYWRVAYGNLTGYPSAPTSNFFAGQLDYFTYYQSALPASVIASHYAVGD
ncbi:MAG TPA: LamG domain-containing protein [Propionibacteriaceae bacterium]